MKIHRSKTNKPQCFDIEERRPIPVTESAAQSNRSLHRKERKAQPQKSLNSEEIIRAGTQITRIGRIYTDPCLSVSTVAPVDVAQPSRQLTPCTRMPAHCHKWTRPQGAQPLTYGSCHTWRSMFYRNPVIIDDDKKPQMNADKRRLIALFYRKERKAKVVFQTGLTGSTGYVLSFDQVHPVIMEAKFK
jgi:hypothetical protein